MCLVFVVKNRLPSYPLVVLFNRDESYERSTAPLHRWDDGSHIVAGRDLVRGGTWAGATKEGKFACVTFIREPYPDRTKKRSRGLLITDFLSSSCTPHDFAAKVNLSPDSYWGFNLLLRDGEQLCHYSNKTGVVTELTSGIHGISNADLDTPWPKVMKGKQALERIVRSGSFSKENCLKLMKDKERASDAELPATGISADKEQALSAIMVRFKDYGTRSTSLIMFSAEGGIEFTEWIYDPQSGRVVGEKTLELV